VDEYRDHPQEWVSPFRASLSSIANSLQILFLPRFFALCLVLCFYQPAACTHAQLSSIAPLWANLVLVNHAVSLFADFGIVYMNLGNVNSKQIVLGYAINISQNSPCLFLFANSSIPFMLSAVLAGSKCQE
jgi:hypothetical protein